MMEICVLLKIIKKADSISVRIDWCLFRLDLGLYSSAILDMKSAGFGVKSFKELTHRDRQP